MALIAPTVDSVGDAALTNSIIDKSITEFQDELVTDIREHAFYNCTALKKAVFGSVSDVDDRAFDGCTALTTVDFHTSTPIGDYAFNNCSALTALILRGATLCHAVSGTFQNSGIASGNGYIYVPAALLDAYKAHSAWGQYSSQIRAIEDYPEMVDPYSWETVAIAIEKGIYKDWYKIGDTVPVDLGSEGIINMQIAAFDVDTLADGSGTAAISWISETTLDSTYKYQSSGAAYVEDGNAGWLGSEIRAKLKSNIYPLIPAEVAEQIVTVRKTQTAAYADGSGRFEQMSEDNIWIPSDTECLKSGIYTGLFVDDNSRKKTRPTNKTTYVQWWLRYNYSVDTTNTIGASGSKSATTTSSSKYAAIGFCTGRTPA